MLNESEEIQTGGNSGISIERIAFIEGLVAQGGPKPTEYDAFTAWTNAMADDGRAMLELLLWGLNGISAALWRRLHNQTHHVQTNTIKDTDRRSRQFFAHRKHESAGHL